MMLHKNLQLIIISAVLAIAILVFGVIFYQVVKAIINLLILIPEMPGHAWNYTN
jgi:hypothetical protein